MLKHKTLPLLVMVILIVSIVIFAFPLLNLEPINTTSQTTETGNQTKSTSNTLTTSTTSNQVKIVNKTISSGYVMGNPVDVGLLPGMAALFIEDPAGRVSIRFTAQLGGEVTSVVINPLPDDEQPKVYVGLQEDNGGTPKGEWLNGSGFGAAQLSAKEGFLEVQLQKSVLLSKGEVYHIVIEPAQESLKNPITIAAYMANGLAQPLNQGDPDINWPDARMNILSYSSGKWHEENKWPIFVVKYKDGSSEGQPYSLDAPWVVYSSTYVGQTIIPASNYLVEKIACVVSLKSDQPQDNLFYEIIDSNDKVLAKGIFAESNQLTTNEKWVEVSLSEPIALKLGELYRIVLYSPGTDLQRGYFIYGHEFCFDSRIGYGGLQHRLTSSFDSGLTWSDNDDADTIFRLTTSG